MLLIVATMVEWLQSATFQRSACTLIEPTFLAKSNVHICSTQYRMSLDRTLISLIIKLVHFPSNVLVIVHDKTLLDLPAYSFSKIQMCDDHNKVVNCSEGVKKNVL